MSLQNRYTAKVGVWNMGQGPFGRIDAARIDQQTEVICHMDCDVLALVEINPLSLGQTLVDALSAKGLNYDLTLPEQPNSPLHIGLLSKPDVTVQNVAFINGSDLNDPVHRQAVDIKVRMGNYDTQMIIVHLKSSRLPASQAIRSEQAKVISDYIFSNYTGKQRQDDVILCGDFNMIPGQDIENFHDLSANGTIDFLSSWDLQERFSHILEAGRSNLLDGFAINKKYSTEYIRGSLELYQAHWSRRMGLERFRQTISDHLPFVASFRINKDRD